MVCLLGEGHDTSRPDLGDHPSMALTVAGMEQDQHQHQQQHQQQLGQPPLQPGDAGGWALKRSPSSMSTGSTTTNSGGGGGGPPSPFPIMVAPGMPVPFGVPAPPPGMVVFPSAPPQAMRGERGPGMAGAPPPPPPQGAYYGLPVPLLPTDYMRFSPGAPPSAHARGFHAQPPQQQAHQAAPPHILPRQQQQQEVQILPKPVEDEDDSVCDDVSRRSGGGGVPSRRVRGGCSAG